MGRGCHGHRMDVGLSSGGAQPGARARQATPNPFGLTGYELVPVTAVAATGRLVAYLTRGTLPEDDEAECPVEQCQVVEALIPSR
jgi:hypothetical protein